MSQRTSEANSHQFQVQEQTNSNVQLLCKTKRFSSAPAALALLFDDFLADPAQLQAHQRQLFAHLRLLGAWQPVVPFRVSNLRMVEASRFTPFCCANSRCKVVEVHKESFRSARSRRSKKASTSFVTFHGFLPHLSYLKARLPKRLEKSLWTRCTVLMLGILPARFRTPFATSSHSHSLTSRRTMTFFWFAKSNDFGCTISEIRGMASKYSLRLVVSAAGGAR